VVLKLIISPVELRLRRIFEAIVPIIGATPRVSAILQLWLLVGVVVNTLIESFDIGDVAVVVLLVLRVVFGVPLSYKFFTVIAANIPTLMELAQSFPEDFSGGSIWCHALTNQVLAAVVKVPLEVEFIVSSLPEKTLGGSVRLKPEAAKRVKANKFTLSIASILFIVLFGDLALADFLVDVLILRVF